MAIHFGTDGWRAVIAEEFTFANVRRVIAAIDRALSSVGPPRAEAPPVVVGYDTRFLSRMFATAAAETLLGAGRRVLLSDQACPTPASSCQVVASSSPFAVVITASHNPAVFNGVKIKDSTGASAGSEITSAAEAQLADVEPASTPISEGLASGRFQETSFAAAHRDRLCRMVDLPAIASAGFKIAVEPMHGACGRLLETMLAGSKCDVVTIHADPDPLFGGRHPEPVEQNLEDLRRLVPGGRFDVGFATDGDGDRIGAFDERGQFVSPLRIAPLLALNLIKKGRRGPIGKTFANTLLLDRIARHFGLPFVTFPVGFKYIAAE
ncbi:MAG TPA: phosphoglucomutase/phosphomannomutase family protein, partial [Candidatus Polarisedimenticolia bacterium]|nr:phosphoglucomutase/phosphomannomutase family protein [Candidatus Polarisedimenticolia bacterium]